MKKVLLTILLLSTTILITNAQAPTTPASGFYVDGLDGNQFRLNYTRGDGDKVLIIAREGSTVTAIPTDGVDYTANYDFGSGNEIAPGEFVVYKGTYTAPTIRNLNFNTTYHFRIFEFNGTNTSTEYLTNAFELGSGTTLDAPTTQASVITFSNVLGYEMDINWVNGNGAGRILIAREDEAVNIEPSNLVKYNSQPSYNPTNPTYPNEIGVGNYVIYQGAGTTATITNIDPNKTYHFALFEYNGYQGKVYLRPGAIAEQISADFPTVAATNFNPYTIDGNQINYNFTKGNGKYRIIIAKEGSAVTAAPVDGSTYTANTTFGDGQDLGNGNFVVYNNTGSGSQLYNLNPNTTYHFKVFEYNKNKAGNETYYLVNNTLDGNATTISAPTTQASNITFTNVLGTGMTVNFDVGDGAGRILVARAGNAVNTSPTDLIDYYASTTYNLQHPTYSNEIGIENYVMYKGNGGTVNITNLTPNVIYHFEVFEYNGNNGKMYLRPGAIASITTPAAPTAPATNLVFSQIDGDRFAYSCTRGNGAKRIVVLKEGSPVTFTPVDGIEYTANNYLGSATDVGDGNFIMYNNTSSYGTLYELNPSTTYYVKIFEYNGSGVDTFYLTASTVENNQATLSAPTAQGSNITFTEILGTSMKVSWTKGNDSDGSMLVIRENNTVNAVPVDLTSYPFFGNTYGFDTSLNQMIGDNYTVYRGPGNATGTIVGLKPNTTYHFELFQYNGSSGKIYLTPGITASQITGTKPTVAASNLNFANIDGNKLYYNFTVGNGEKRIVVAKQGAPVTFTPIDGQEYVKNSTLGAGLDLGGGNFIIENFTSWSSSFDGLVHSQEYFIKVFEYNGSGTNTYYLTDTSLEGSETTLSPPTIQTSNYFVDSKTTNSISLSWTKGDGTYRILIARADSAVDYTPVDYTTYSTGTNYGSGYAEIGVGNYGVYAGTGTNTTVNNLNPNTTYYFDFYEYNGSSGKLYLNPAYSFSVKTKVATPTVQISAPLFNFIGGSSMQINFTKGNGTNRLVLVKEGGAVDADPIDLTDYLGDANFGDGFEIGTGNFVVHNSTTEEFILTNLNHSTTYHFAFYEYATDVDGALYFKPGATANATTPSIPLLASTGYTTTPPCTNDVDIEWTPSTAFGSLVIASSAPLNTMPTNGTDYTFNFDYGVGDAIGNGFVVYKGTGNLVPINNLLPNTFYYINIFEFNGTEQDPVFKMEPLSGIVGDNTPPTTIVKNIEIFLDVNGTVSLVPNDIDDGSFDDCTIQTMTIDKNSFDCTDIGLNTVRLTATDIFGNSNFSDTTVTVTDNSKPTLTAISDKIIGPDAGTCDSTLLNYISETTVADNCNVQSVTQSPVAGTTISGENTQQIVTITANDGNGNIDTTTFTVTLDCTVLANEIFDLEGFSIYPNPVKDVLTIKSGTLNIENIEIFDTLGKSLKKVNMIDETISTKDLPIGVYMLRITTDKGIVIRKIVKM